MFLIGEFSGLTQVSVRMLRYYDEQGLLHPSVTDPLTNYRLYSSEQIPRLQKILLLRDLNFTVSEIACALENWNSDSFAVLLEHKRIDLEAVLVAQKERLRRLEIAQQDLRGETLAVHCNVLIRRIPAIKIWSLRRVIPRYDCEGDLWRELCECLGSQPPAPMWQNGNVAIYHGDGPDGEGVDVEVGAIVSETCSCQLPLVFRELEAIETMACAMVSGPYENISPTYYAFAQWLEAHQQYRIAGLTRQVCHKGPDEEADPQNFLTEIQIPVIKIPSDESNFLREKKLDSDMV